MDKNQLIYNAAKEYLDSIKPSSVNLYKYFLGDSRDFSSLNDIYIQFIRSAQNYQRMPKWHSIICKGKSLKKCMFNDIILFTEGMCKGD